MYINAIKNEITYGIIVVMCKNADVYCAILFPFLAGIVCIGLGVSGIFDDFDDISIFIIFVGGVCWCFSGCACCLLWYDSDERLYALALHEPESSDTDE